MVRKNVAEILQNHVTFELEAIDPLLRRRAQALPCSRGSFFSNETLPQTAPDGYNPFTTCSTVRGRASLGFDL